MPITAFYAALLAPLFIVLSVRTIRARGAAGIAVGDGGNPLLRRRIRVHANFTEYVPLALVLMGLAESMNASPALLHGTAIALVIGRYGHAIGMSRDPEDLRFRIVGMMTTFAVLAVLAATCLTRSLPSIWTG
ncbi:MAG: MAPEG family protein [Acetobacteraceae bacterium]